MAIGTSIPSGSGLPAGLGGNALDGGRFETVPREVAEIESETQAEREARLRREADQADEDRKERPPKAAG
jgi:hypothetical protein